MRRSKLLQLLLSLPLTLIDLVAAQQSPLSPVPLPALDFSSFGQVSVAGDFNGVSLYQFAGQNSTSTASSNSDTVFLQLPNGALSPLGSVDGTISALCALPSALYVAGNFSSIAGVSASNIAAYNFSTASFARLNDRDILGSVASLYCDIDGNQVFVGGDFESGGSNNAIVWNGTSERWVDLPFGGFDGPINVIEPGTSGSMLFGGVFDALGNGTAGGLVDKQVINLVNGNVTSDGTTTTAGFTNPAVLFCNSNGTDGAGSTWLLQDNTPGDMTVLGNFGYRPTRLRLRNTHFDGRGTKTFRFVAQPIDGIMNFTYTDPVTGQNSHCDASCPLSNDTSVEFQDFEFVNVIGMNGFTLFVSDWYGSGGGLTSLELFEDDIVAYADNAFNEPTCLVSTLGSTSSTTGGSFVPVSGFPETSAAYLSSDTGGNVTMTPAILTSGNYSIRLFTPGCIADGTCATRGVVSVSTWFSENEPPLVVPTYQTNDYDKYDTIFQGRVEVGTTSFRPRVEISPQEGQPADQTIVAQKVQFMPLGSNGEVTNGAGIASSGGLNGLYEYAPGNWTASTNITQSTFDGFDLAGADLGFDASIVGIVPVGSEVYVAGGFSSNQLGLHNVMVLDASGNPASVAFGGLNGPVNAVAEVNGTIYFGGAFTATANTSSSLGLNYVAAFNVQNNAWSALGEGLNGNVTSVVLLSMPTSSSTNHTVVVFSGSFTTILGSPTINVPGLAIWIPSQNNWAERLGAGGPFVSGSLSAETATSNGTVFVAGDIMAWQSTQAQSVIGLGNSQLESIPIPASSSPSTNSTRRKRALLQKRALNSNFTSSGSDTVITSGAYYTGNNSNVTVIGGQFTLGDVSNLAFINGSNNAITGLPANTLSFNASIFSLLVTGDKLFIGGAFTGDISSNQVDALAIYDFSLPGFAATQPPALTSSGTVVVNTLSLRPSSTQLLVGGNFASAGSLPCPGVCIYDTSTSQWLRPGSVDITGEVSQIVFEDANTALVVGDISIGGNDTYVGSYDFGTSDWTSLNLGVSGPVSSVVYQDSNDIFLTGTNASGTWFGKWNGQTFVDLTSGILRTSTITDLQFIPLSSNHASNSILSSDRVILLMGSVQLPDFGNASAVLFDGTNFTPYILSTKADGSNGIIYTLFSERTQSFSSQGHVAFGWVIVIALAISLFLILLLVIGGVIAARIRRAREGYTVAPSTPTIGEETLERVPPAQLFGELEGRRRAAAGYL